MSSINEKLNSNLTDIPLNLEHGDGIAITPEKPEQKKSNSLKRFFRPPKRANSKNTQSEGNFDAPCETELKNLLQMRFGSFHKNDEIEKQKTETEPSSSHNAIKSSSETRSKLQERITSYWRLAFKKASKNSKTKKSIEDIDEQTKDETIPPPPNDVDKLEKNQSANL